MDTFVIHIFDFLEYLILGGAVLALIVIPDYGDVAKRRWNSFIDVFVPQSNPRDRRENEKEAASNSDVRQYVAIFVLLALMYVLGIIVNSVAYTVVQPFHKRIIHSVRSSKCCTSDTVLFCVDFVFPFVSWETDAVRRDYQEDNRREYKWMAKNYDTYKKIFSVKQIQLVRGAIFIMIVFAVNRILLRFYKKARFAPTKGSLVYRVLLFVGVYVILMCSYWGLESDFHKALLGIEKIPRVQHHSNTNQAG